MKNLLFIVTFFIFTSCSDKTEKSSSDNEFKAFAQKSLLVDTSFIKTVKLNDITVCNSTITDLRKMGYVLVSHPKDQVDSLINAINWEEGEYFCDKTKNLLFSTYKNTELLSSIFLKADFKGKLRDLTIDNFSKLTVREITNYFKDLHWSTTGASDYWIYGNDTVNFYIKIDNSIPRFPLNEKFYEGKNPVLAKIQFLCSKVYGDEYGKNDTVMRKPLYAPFNDAHINYYLLRRKAGIGTILKEITSAGKKTNMEEIRIGKWLTYNTDHTIKSIEYYNDGKLVSADK